MNLFLKGAALKGKNRSKFIPSYSKCPKISNTLFQTFFTYLFVYMHLFCKVLSGMAKHVDLGQTAPSGAISTGSAPFANAMLSDTSVH